MMLWIIFPIPALIEDLYFVFLSHYGQKTPLKRGWKLLKREKEFLGLVSEGLTTLGIAEMLFVRWH